MIPTIKRRPLADDSALPPLLHPRIRQIYASRGAVEAKDLEQRLQGLDAPSGLKGLEQALTLLVDALAQQKSILVVGDFDCDGATSSALMVSALRAMGAQKVDFLIPNRFDYGYGLSPAIAELAGQRGAELLITVDNGISSIEGVATAQRLGMQVLITDHHLPGEQLPAAEAIVNPNQPGCPFPSKSLAGVGVAFYLMMALRARLVEIDWFSSQGLFVPNLASYLDLVALGTVADLVALDRTNRILVYQGLQRMRAGACRPGLQALLKVAGREGRDLKASDLGFVLAPRLNAVGRLQDMTLGVSCLLSEDAGLALQMAETMDGLNRERKKIEEEMKQDALAMLDELQFNENALPMGLVLHQEDWHQGVVGLVASRVKERYHRPVIAFARVSDSELKGSARSINGVHIRDLLERLDRDHPELIQKFGGHAMAAGLSLDPGKLELFRELFTREIASSISEDQLQGELLTDGELSSHELSMEMADELHKAGPWGQAFPEPCFDGVFRILNQRLVGEKHLKLTLEPEQGEPPSMGSPLMWILKPGPPPK